jgi:hypothetical protein
VLPMAAGSLRVRRLAGAAPTSGPPQAAGCRHHVTNAAYHHITAHAATECGGTVCERALHCVVCVARSDMHPAPGPAPTHLLVRRHLERRQVGEGRGQRRQLGWRRCRPPAGRRHRCPQRRSGRSRRRFTPEPLLRQAPRRLRRCSGARLLICRRCAGRGPQGRARQGAASRRRRQQRQQQRAGWRPACRCGGRPAVVGPRWRRRRWGGAAVGAAAGAVCG